MKKHLLLLLLFVTGMAVPRVCARNGPPELLFFYSETCEECHRVMEEFLPGFLGTYGDRIHYRELEVSEPAVMDSLIALESRVGVPEGEKDFPAVYFMGHMLEGEVPVRLRLEGLVKAYLANPDSLGAIHREVMAREPVMVETEVPDDARTVHIAYFNRIGCSECSRAEEVIDWLTGTYPFVEVDVFDIGDETGKLYATELGLRTGVPETRLMSTPVLFFGDITYLLSENITRENMAHITESLASEGARPAWRDFGTDDLARSRNTISTMFDDFTVLAVMLAGLGDGINPCAFATILFFVSYLGMVGRKRNEILAVGLSFALAVFLTYFLVGLGMYRLLQHLTHIELLSKIIFGGTGIVCIVFGFLSINDYFKARVGRSGDMSLQLPDALKRRIHTTIRQGVRTRGYIAGALVIGFLVSILELACTGQVYLPTITMMVGKDALAVPYLFLYNLCFIAPLLAVFGVVYFGISSRAVGSLMESRLGQVKLVLAGIFFLLGAVLLWTVM